MHSSVDKLGILIFEAPFPNAQINAFNTIRLHGNHSPFPVLFCYSKTLPNSFSYRLKNPPFGRKHDTTAIQTSLNKAISPTFEIVFAGAFSAGKSMLINALLGRKLLYSAEGHATGTECHIAYAAQDQERVVLTFLSEAEIIEQANALIARLKIQFQKDLLDAVTRQKSAANVPKHH